MEASTLNLETRDRLGTLSIRSVKHWISPSISSTARKGVDRRLRKDLKGSPTTYCSPMVAAFGLLFGAVVVGAIRQESSVSSFQQLAADRPRIHDTAIVSSGNEVGSNPDPQADHEENPHCIGGAICTSRYSDILATNVKTVAQVVAARAAPDGSEALREESLQDAAVGERTHLRTRSDVVDAVGQGVGVTKVGDRVGESSNGESDRRSDNRKQAAAKSWTSQPTLDAESAGGNVVSNTIISSGDTGHRTNPTIARDTETTFARGREGATYAAMPSSLDEELSCPALLVSSSCANWGALQLPCQRE